MQKKTSRIFLLFSILYSGYLFAAMDMTCFSSAAINTGVSKEVLIAIAKVESGFNPRAVHRNRNGTLDIGVMQINTAHLQLLADAGISRDDLFEPCVNIHVGARILRQCVEKYGNTWRAVAAYNPGDPTYPHKVFRAMSAIKQNNNKGWR